VFSAVRLTSLHVGVLWSYFSGYLRVVFHLRRNSSECLHSNSGFTGAITATKVTVQRSTCSQRRNKSNLQSWTNFITLLKNIMGIIPNTFSDRKCECLTSGPDIF
jgi:hypothetical protein